MLQLQNVPGDRPPGAAEFGFFANSVGEAIFSESDPLIELRKRIYNKIREAVKVQTAGHPPTEG